MTHSVLKLAVTMLVAAIAAPVLAVELRAADIQPEDYPNVVALQNLGRKLEAASKGRLSLRVFPGGILGDERSMIEQTQAGSIDLLRASLGSVGTIVPEVNVFNLRTAVEPASVPFLSTLARGWGCLAYSPYG